LLEFGCVFARWKAGADLVTNPWQQAKTNAGVIFNFVDPLN
jgi:hypothetical protein